MSVTTTEPSGVKDWFGLPYKEMTDSHLENALPYAQRKVDLYAAQLVMWQQQRSRLLVEIVGRRRAAALVKPRHCDTCGSDYICTVFCERPRQWRTW